MKLKDIDFNQIKKKYGLKEISIGKAGDWHTGFVEEILISLPKNYAEREVKEIREFFGSCVIEIE